MKKDTKMLSYFVAFFLFAVATAFVTSFFFRISSANIAIIPIHAEIGLSGSPFTGTTSDSLISHLTSAENNPNVEVIVLSVNSGGGSVVACQEVVEHIKLIEKPVIAWIRDIGASGAYWIASAADYILASPSSFTGFIGVRLTYLDFSGLFEKYGITYWNFTMPIGKDFLTEYRSPSDEEILMVEEILNKTYHYFLDDVALNRNLTKEYLINVTKEGAILTGEQAYEVDLVDYLGNREAMLTLAKSIGNLSYAETEIYQIDLLEKASSFLYGLNKFIIKV